MLLRLDAAESAFFQRELEHIKAATYDVKYPMLKARQFVPVSGEAHPGAEAITYRQMDQKGRAKIVGPKGKDLPRVDVHGKEFTRPVRTIGDSYGWDLFELRNAAMANRPLGTMRAEAARRAIEEVIDQVACFGSAVDGIATGFLNSTDVPTNPATGAWAGLTPAQIVADISNAYKRIKAATQGIESPDTLLLDDESHALIATTPRSDNSDTTILEFVRRTFPGLTAIEPWYRLAEAGVGDVKRMVIYARSPNILTQDIPSEFEQLPVQENGLEFEVSCVARTAGTALYYPKAIDYTDGL